MASPMLETRVEPHKKAHFNLHISDRITHGDDGSGSYSSVKYNHKPSQTSDHRSTKLTATGRETCRLTLDDTGDDGNRNIFQFTGSRASTKKSYVLLFEPTAQKATLEPLADSYTFNLATRNGTDISSQHAKIYPKKNKDGSADATGDDDLFGEVGDDESGDPDPANPYDFRHFLNHEKRGDESEYNASSPDYRGGAGTGSAANTPLLVARKPATTTTKPKAAQPAPKKRKTAVADPFVKKKPGPKKTQAAPTVRLERAATDRSTADSAPKPRGRAPAASSTSKYKSEEIVHSSDDADMDEDGEPDASSPAIPTHQRSPSPAARRSPSPSPAPSDAQADSDSDSDATGGALEIEVPDARPTRPRKTGGALASLGLGQNIGTGHGFLRSPSNGPISLASSVQGSPNPERFGARGAKDAAVIDFGSLGGEDAEGEEEEEEGEEEEEEEGDGDVDELVLGPPARQGTAGHERKASTVVVEEEEDDPLYKEMMAGLAGGDSSEESEEE